MYKEFHHQVQLCVIQHELRKWLLVFLRLLRLVVQSLSITKIFSVEGNHYDIYLVFYIIGSEMKFQNWPNNSQGKNKRLELSNCSIQKTLQRICIVKIIFFYMHIVYKWEVKNRPYLHSGRVLLRFINFIYRSDSVILIYIFSDSAQKEISVNSPW